MAIYVIMNKIEDDKKKVVYEFGPNEKTMGIIEFNKIEKSFNVKKRLVMLLQLICYMKDVLPKRLQK